MNISRRKFPGGGTGDLGDKRGKRSKTVESVCQSICISAFSSDIFVAVYKVASVITTEGATRFTSAFIFLSHDATCRARSPQQNTVAYI
jgi:hypothetical protein